MNQTLAIVPVEMPEDYYSQLQPVIDAYLYQNPTEDVHTLFQRAVAYYLLMQDTPGSAALLVQTYPAHGRAAA